LLGILRKDSKSAMAHDRGDTVLKPDSKTALVIDRGDTVLKSGVGGGLGGGGKSMPHTLQQAARLMNTA